MPDRLAQFAKATRSILSEGRELAQPDAVEIGMSRKAYFIVAAVLYAIVIIGQIVATREQRAYWPLIAPLGVLLAIWLFSRIHRRNG